MSIRQGKKLIASSTTNGFNLFDCKWADHILNNISWLRADTFSWQSGDVYVAAYQHLVDDINGKTLQSETIGGTTIQFYLADDGHKICPASEESNVSAIYNSTGVAWYYILDTTNRQFKLPRTKFGFTGIRSGVGGYVEAGLPNITGDFYFVGAGNSRVYGSASGAFKVAGKTSGGNQVASASGAGSVNDTWTFDASRSSSIYGNSTTVQPPATQMYLYFYVGNYVANATTIDAGKLAEAVNDFDIDTFKPQVDEAKNSAISDINEATSNSVEQLKNMGEVVNYTNITNCITEIPQDIKLKYSGNTLILKAGSKTYIPNGTGVFDEVVIANNISLSISTDTVCAIGYNHNANTIYNWALSDCYSGTTEPSASYALWYDTKNNLVKQKINDVITNSVSLPIATITVSNGAISSIDQVFNGFGYIGSTVFVLPGVKGLIPDGRNPDGTLNNIKCTTSQVATLTVNGNRRIHVAIRDNGTLGWWNTSGTRYDANQNFNYYNDFIQYCAVVGKFDVSNGRIQNFRPYNTFHAVDYNSGDYVIEFQAPTSTNGYTWYRKYKSGWVEQGVIFVEVATAIYTFNFPILMANTNYAVMTSIFDALNTTTMTAKYFSKTTTSVNVRNTYQTNSIHGDIMVYGMSA